MEYFSLFLDEKEEYDPTGTADYIKACYALGVVPTNHFIRSLQSQDTVIELSNHYVGPVGAKAIAMALKVGHRPHWYIIIIISLVQHDSHTLIP